MPAGAVGPCWVSGSWPDTAWEAGSWGSALTPAVVPPSPLSLVMVTGNTSLIFVTSAGAIVPSPDSFTVGTTGAYRMLLVGSDGTREDVTLASSVTLRVVSTQGNVVVNAVALDLVTPAQGVVSWNRLSAQVANAGDYLAQVTVVRSDGSVGFFPDDSRAASPAITMLAAT